MQHLPDGGIVSARCQVKFPGYSCGRFVKGNWGISTMYRAATLLTLVKTTGWRWPVVETDFS